MTTFAMPQHAPEKPRHGQPCNGCGFCCAAEVCDLGLHVHGDETPAPCPSLTFHDGRFWCGLIEFADHKDRSLSAKLRFSLGVGFGCDADDPDDHHSQEQGK